MSLNDSLEVNDTFPGQVAPIIVPQSKDRPTFIEAQWGMVPAWAKDANYGKKYSYNARSETLLEKPTFRTAFKKRRCIVPATAFYERMAGRWVRFMATEEVLPIAGLYEPPNSLCDYPSFTFITTDPNEVVGEVQDRMPVVLDLEDIPRWLDQNADVNELRTLLIPCPPSWTRVEDAGPIRPPKQATDPQPINRLFD
jgi:putative SOS response-associated peptidase YedK